MLAKLRGILSLGIPFILGGCNMENLPLLDPKGQLGVDEKTLIVISTILMLLVVVPVIVMTCVFAWRYRATNTKATYKPEWDFSHKIEVIVWTVPCLIVLALSIICWRSTHELDPANPIQSSVKPIEIDVVALDWKWLFIYPEQNVASVNEVAFPVDTPVKFVITSDSVMNSFFIPSLGTQLVIMPGMKETLYQIADYAGTYDGISGQFSGDGFSGMRFKALAGTKTDFDAWVAKAKLSTQQLSAATYPALTKPSEDVPVVYYSYVEPTLFDAIIDKYMDTPVYKKDTATKMDGKDPMQMDMNAEGAK